MHQLYVRYSGLAISHIFAVYLVLPVLGPYLRAMGHSQAWISAVFGLFGIGVLIAGVFAGTLAHRYGRRWVLRGGLLLNIVAIALYMYASSWAIIFGKLLDGICFSIIVVISLSLIEDNVENNTRGSKTGLLLSLQSAARLLGPIVGGILADYYIGAPFLVSIGIFIGLALSLRDANLHQPHDKPKPLFERLSGFFHHHSLRPLMVLGFAISASIPIIVLFIPLVITDKLGLSYAQAGFAISIYSASHLLNFFFGHLVDNYGRKRLATLGGFIYGIALIAIALGDYQYSQLLLLVALSGIGNSLWGVAATSYLSEVAGRYGEREETIGTYVSVVKLGEVVSFFLAGLLVSSIGERGVFLTLGGLVIGCSIVSAVLFIRLASRQNPQTHLSG